MSRLEKNAPQRPRRRTKVTMEPKIWSTAMKNSAAKTTMMRTITLVIQTSFQVGQVTFAAS